MDDVDIDKCPICPSSGLPTRPPSNPAATFSSATIAGGVGADDELHWIACSKCSTWFHSVCILQSSDDHAATVPQSIRDELDKHDGVWTNWGNWVDRWYCRECLDYSISPENPRPPHHPLKATIKSSFPPRARDDADSPGPSKRAKTEEARPKRKAAENAPDYYAWNHGIASPTANWINLIMDPAKYGKDIREGNFPRIPAGLLGQEWLEGGGGEISPELFYGPDRRPMLVKPENGGIEGMGGKLPGQELTVGDVAEQVGRNRMVDVIDVATQTSSQWNLGKWATYFSSTTEPEWSGKVYNIISLEITGTPLAKRVKPPRVVREVDWVDNFWPFEGKKKGKEDTPTPAPSVGEEEWAQEKVKPGAKWPKVQLYCLMGIRGSWTDWHVDFAASSVYYSIHTGAKEFYFIKPTENNLKAYATWSGSAELQQREWLGDMCEGGVEKVRLHAGDTMIIPAGWIHAVYTPANSIVFGGNFLHSYSIPTQLRLRQIEIDTKVPQRFRFPFFERLCWYVADRYCTDLRVLRSYKPKVQAKRPIDVVLKGLLELANFLKGQADVIEDTTVEDKVRKAGNDRVPVEVKDPSGLARELIWRVRRELGESEQVAPPVDVKEEVKVKETKLKKKLEHKMLPIASRTVGVKTRPWTIDAPPLQLSETHRIDQPGTAMERTVDEVIEQGTQIRRREYQLDGGVRIVEEQTVVFTEKRTTFGAGSAKTVVVDIKTAVPVKLEGVVGGGQV